MAKFKLGKRCFSGTILRRVTQKEITYGFYRHARGDWGDIPLEGGRKNENAVDQNMPICSTYTSSSGARFCIITSKDRSKTVAILANELRMYQVH